MDLSATEIRRRNFTAAVEAAGGVEEFCRRFEMNSDYVRQLLRGGETKSGRNIGHKSARAIEAKLGLAPNALDHPGKRVAAAVAPQSPTQPSTPQARLEHDMSAVRLALGALVAGLALSRPAEAEAVEAALREAPKALQDNGLLAELLAVLGEGQKRAARPGPSPAPKPQS